MLSNVTVTTEAQDNKHCQSEIFRAISMASPDQLEPSLGDTLEHWHHGVTTAYRLVAGWLKLAGHLSHESQPGPGRAEPAAASFSP